ncbi:hypothetical protein RM553_06265 [Zunongwangia sp. F363]|uniref:Lipoprotein n=1 Tax=Autumnicola tepida TaxID=3075595 RepID=A0ABU3C834_9FLAO|nr:hypothetical protein [Zunongwangia sp. F363]MDT0642433.1 hypothetical protein [Zunongwangia sp. F363]
MKNLLIFTLLIILATGCKNNNNGDSVASAERPAIAREIAKANGLDKFNDVEQINFTFNVKVQDSLRSQRSWQWKPETDEVTLTENNTSTTYKRDGELNEDEKSADQKFINDTYWLLFPYQLVWSDADISKEENATAPISGEKMDKLTVSYTGDGGYTPGDTYDIYYDDDLILREWVYKAADGNREMATTWENYEDFNGLKIAKNHKSPDGSFELFFDDIAVK